MSNIKFKRITEMSGWEKPVYLFRVSTYRDALRLAHFARCGRSPSYDGEQTEDAGSYIAATLDIVRNRIYEDRRGKP